MDNTPSGWLHDPQSLLLTTLYLVHVPLFVALTGVTSKVARLRRRLLWLLALMLVLQVLYVVPLTLVTGRMPTGPLSPYWLLWFLVAMCWWTLSLPLVKRAPVAMLVVSVAAAALGGLVPVPGNVLAYSRSLFYWPFFIVGHVWGRQLLSNTARVSTATRAAAGLVVVGLGLAVWSVRPDPHWLFGNQSFTQLHASPFDGILARLLVLAVMAAASGCALMFVPSRAAGVQSIGRRSLAVFLLHPVAILAYEPLARHVARLAGSDGALTTLCLVLAAVVVAALARPVFDQALRRCGDTVADRFAGSASAPR